MDLNNHLLFRQAAAVIAPLQVVRLGGADHIVGRAALLEVGTHRTAALVEGAERRKVAQSRQIHQTLQCHEFLVQVRKDDRAYWFLYHIK